MTLSLSEIRFDLSLLGPQTSPQPVWSFATTPDHMVTMHQGFAVAIDSYRRRYGEIRAVQVDPAMVRFADGYADG